MKRGGDRGMVTIQEDMRALTVFLRGLGRPSLGAQYFDLWLHGASRMASVGHL